jgi:hypothetical protein
MACRPQATTPLLRQAPLKVQQFASAKHAARNSAATLLQPAQAALRVLICQWYGAPATPRALTLKPHLVAQAMLPPGPRTQLCVPEHVCTSVCMVCTCHP